MIKPVTPVAVQRRLRSKKEPVSRTVTEQFIALVNAKFATPESIRACRTPTFHGQRLYVRAELYVTPEDCLQIQKTFFDAGWPEVHLIYFWDPLRKVHNLSATFYFAKVGQSMVFYNNHRIDNGDTVAAAA